MVQSEKIRYGGERGFVIRKIFARKSEKNLGFSTSTPSAGLTLISLHYDNSLMKALQAAYPEHDFYEWCFGMVPRNFWKKNENYRRFFDWLGKKLNVKKLEDWYNVSGREIRENGGMNALASTRDSPLNALARAYPEHQWHGWMFKKAPQHFWNNDSNVREYVEWLEKDLGITSREQWYPVSVRTIKKKYGAGLINGLGDSVCELVMKVYPEHAWLPWKFDRARAGFWDVKANQRRFLEWLGKELKFQSMEDWYGVTREQIEEHGGSFHFEQISREKKHEKVDINGVDICCGLGISLLAHQYNSSVSAAVMAVFSEHRWIPWKFQAVHKGFWSSRDNQKAFFDYAAKEIGIKKPSDWYSVNYKTLAKLGGSHSRFFFFF
jgi:hypothetical protein